MLLGNAGAERKNQRDLAMAQPFKRHADVLECALLGKAIAAFCLDVGIEKGSHRAASVGLLCVDCAVFDAFEAGLFNPIDHHLLGKHSQRPNPQALLAIQRLV
jgi:hypothetical protein